MSDDKEFTFKQNADMDGLSKQIGESLAKTIGVDPSKVKCKGIRIFYVEEDSQMLMSSGLFVKDFSPEDWDDE